jgi:hypothetical protein
MAPDHGRWPTASHVDGFGRVTEESGHMRLLKLGGWVAIPLAFVVHWWVAPGAAWEPMATFTLAALRVIPAAAHVETP